MLVVCKLRWLLRVTSVTAGNHIVCISHISITVEFEVVQQSSSSISSFRYVATWDLTLCVCVRLIKLHVYLNYSI